MPAVARSWILSRPYPASAAKRPKTARPAGVAVSMPRSRATKRTCRACRAATTYMMWVLLRPSRFRRAKVTVSPARNVASRSVSTGRCERAADFFPNQAVYARDL